MPWKCVDIHGHEKIYRYRNRSDNEMKRNPPLAESWTFCEVVNLELGQRL